MSVRILLSWTCYWLGDLACRINDGLCRGYIPGGFQAYQWLMARADDLQAGDPRGPWRDAVQGCNDPNCRQTMQSPERAGMIERVARAMCVADGFNPDQLVYGGWTWEAAHLPRGPMGSVLLPAEASCSPAWHVYVRLAGVALDASYLPGHGGSP